MRIVAHWNLSFDENLKNKLTDDNSSIDLSDSTLKDD